MQRAHGVPSPANQHFTPKLWQERQFFLVAIIWQQQIIRSAEVGRMWRASSSRNNDIYPDGYHGRAICDGHISAEDGGTFALLLVDLFLGVMRGKGDDGGSIHGRDGHGEAWYLNNEVLRSWHTTWCHEGCWRMLLRYMHVHVNVVQLYWKITYWFEYNPIGCKTILDCVKNKINYLMTYQFRLHNVNEFYYIVRNH
jgi:hypothetical protein